MNYLAAAISEQGIVREVNQDGLMIRNRMTQMGNLCLCVICDGMGGLAQGEVASSHVVRRISDWFIYKSGGIKRFDKFVFYLENELSLISKELFEYGRRKGFLIGTTATILAVVGGQYAIVHVGDTRVYAITKGIYVKVALKTVDQSVNDYMLTQSVGTGERIIAQVVRGKLHRGDIFIMCTDGFRHKNSLEDIRKGFNPAEIKNTVELEKKLRIYVDRARRLGETDDISVLGLKVI